jgi:hypothetical protein
MLLEIGAIFPPLLAGGTLARAFAGVVSLVSARVVEIRETLAVPANSGLHARRGPGMDRASRRGRLHALAA